MALTRIEFETMLSAELARDPLPATEHEGTALIAWRDRLLAVVERLQARLGPEAKQQIKAMALAVYDAWDVPYIGGTIEARVKAEFRPLVEATLDKVLGITPAGPSRALWIGGGVGSAVLSLVLALFTGVLPMGCPAPQPVPPVVVPEPEPKPVPPAPPAIKVTQLILVHESSKLDHNTSRLVESLQAGKGAKWLAEKGYTLLGVIDPNDVNAAGGESTLVRQWKGEFAGAELPLLLLLDRDGKLVRKEPLPADATEETVQSLVEAAHAESSFADLPYVDCDFNEWEQFGKGDITEVDTFEAAEAPQGKAQEPKFGQADARGPPGVVAEDGDAEPVFEDAVPSIERKQWPDLIHRIDEAGGSLDLLVTYINNQKQEGTCTSNATAKALEIAYGRQFGLLNVIRFSPVSIYKPVASGPNSGSMVSANMRQIMTVGALPLDTPENRARFAHVFPATGYYTRYPEGWKETAKLFRAHEVFDIRSTDGFVTALLLGYPVVYGRDGHAICAVRPVYRGGKLYVKYANSWSPEWGDHGFGYDSEAKINSGARWAFAIRTAVEPVLVKHDEPAKTEYTFVPLLSRRAVELMLPAKPEYAQAP